MNIKKSVNIANIDNEEIIKLKKKYLFIGPWCKKNIDLYSEKFNDTINIHNKKQNLKKYKNDIIILKKNYNFILDLVFKKLNFIHKKKFNKRFWEILLSRWLFTWINHAYFRWDYVTKINNKFKISKFITKHSQSNYTAPLNTEEAHYAYRTDNIWSELTFNQILNFKFKNKKKFIFLKKNKIFKKSKFQVLNYPKFIFLEKKYKFYLYKSEINPKTKLKIIKNFGSFPIIFFSNQKIYIKKNNLRKEFENLLPKSKKINFTNFLISTIKYNLPYIFLENFEDLKNLYQKSNWPKNVDFIITSYGQYYDELFKLYLAKQISNKKSKLCILQHGYGNFFIKDDFFNVYLDRKISDIFLSWGNLKKNKNKPFFYPRITNTNNLEFKFRDNLNILIISYSFSNNLLFPLSGPLNGDITNQKNLYLLTSLINKIKQKFKNKIYLKNQNNHINNNFSNSLIKKLPFIKIINEKKNFLKVIDKFNLFIHIFFGTPFFECMALNRPSIIIHQENAHPPFDKKFISHLEKLKKNNILFDNEQIAANFILRNYNFLEKWWNGKGIQKTIRDFCNDYCLYTNKDIKIFKKNFKKKE